MIIHVYLLYTLQCFCYIKTATLIQHFIQLLHAKIGSVMLYSFVVIALESDLLTPIFLLNA